MNNETLLLMLGSAEWSVRAGALSALEAQGSAAIPTILIGMTSADAQVRAHCTSLLDHLADDRCIEPLRTALTDPSPDVRRHAVHSLGCQQCKPLPLNTDIVALLIDRALNDKSIRVRRVAVHQLGLQEKDPRALTALKRILSTDNDEKLLERARFAYETLSVKTHENSLCRR